MLNKCLSPVSLVEVKNAVWDCGSSKAPGPNGFSFAFVKKYWDVIKVDILEYVNIILDTGSLPHRFNSSFFTLIPKFRACLSSSWASILVNGSPTSEFSIKCGLKKGDPLSHFLFILVMEGLHNALSTAVSSGLIRGVKFDSPEVTISHLFYADDMIITTKWKANDLDNIIRVLQVFYLASGLKINIHKSNVSGIGVSDVDVFSMASNSGCASGSFPFTYLGLPIGSNMSLTSSWQVPKAVLNSLERSQAMFFLGGSYEARKLAWIKWKNVFASYDNGGLNIGSLKAFNLALLQKWRWMYRIRTRFGLKFSKIYMVQKVALIIMVASIMDFSTWMEFGGNTRDLGSFEEETEKDYGPTPNLLKIYAYSA
ncbi:putative RNA-directed DNA polymerase, eukaryota, reverse transcriptase zinc-binding domain protein [Tanacetum coccineum]